MRTRRFIAAYQHLVREEQPIALLMAGHPHKIDGLLSGDSTSFLRRAARHNLGMVPRYDIIEAFNLTLQDARRDIEPDAIEEAADIIGGFPFMLQLLGYRTWNMAFGHDVLTVDDVRRGALVAQSELASRVFDATVCELSHADVEFLKAMAQDDGPSRQADVAKRLRKSSGHVSSYKKRLMDAGAPSVYLGAVTYTCGSLSVRVGTQYQTGCPCVQKKVRRCTLRYPNCRRGPFRTNS